MKKEYPIVALLWIALKDSTARKKLKQDGLLLNVLDTTVHAQLVSTVKKELLCLTTPTDCLPRLTLAPNMGCPSFEVCSAILAHTQYLA